MGEKHELAKHIGQRIKSERQKFGITQAELARRCGKDPQAIELVENGKTNPTLYTLYLVSASLEIEMKDLFEGSLSSSI